MIASTHRRAETAEYRRHPLATWFTVITVTLIAVSAAARAETPDAQTQNDDPASVQEAEPDDRPIQEVGEVSITATLGERDPIQVAANVTVLDRAQIDATGARTIPELLRRQPGLFVTSSTSSPAGVQIEARGFNNGGALGSSLLVQVDGRRVNEADTGNTDWSMLPIDEVESIEIVRGTASAIYGDNAVGGVINIRTLPGAGPLKLTSRGRIGRYDTYDGSVRGTGTLGNVTGSLQFTGYDTDAYRDRSSFDNKRVEGSLEYSGDSFAIGAKSGYDDQHREFPGALDPIELRGPRGRRGADPDSTGDESDIETYFVQGWAEVFVADDIQLRVEPYYNHRTDDVKISTAASGQFDIDTKKKSIGVDAQMRVDREIFGRKNRFIAGFEYLRNSVDTDSASGFGLTLIDSKRNVYSGYLQEEFSVNEDLLVSAGMRIDRAVYDIDTEIFGVGGGRLSADRTRPDFTLWSPRASISYRFVEELSGYFAYSRGFRLPNFDEDAPFFGATPDLDPQTSDSLELGIKGRSDRVSGSLALYWMWVDDEILFDPGNFTNTNLDEVRHRGIEAAVDIAICDWLSVYGNYTLDDVKITQEADALRGHRMPLTPLHRGTVGVNARLPYAIELNANLNLVGSRKLANDFGGDLPKLESYQVLDLLFAWRPTINQHLSAEITAGVYNVADEKYNGFGASLTPFSGPFAFTPTRFVNPAAKRTWQVGLGFTVSL